MPNRILTPLIPAYWAASRLHAAWMRARARPAPDLPLILVGALKAGGSGKTSVTAALATALRARGLRVGILAWRVGGGSGGGPAEAVHADSDWRRFSDESVLLARETGCAVFATRDRAAAWRELAPGPFDVLLSDDGFQDRRLEGAFRILLAAPGERPGLLDLLPGGAFRETARARARAHLVLEGPLPEAAEAPRPLHGFRRTFLPPVAEPGPPWVALAALGDARPFLADLARAGIVPRAVVLGANHRPLPLARLAAALSALPSARVVCTAKEAVRLEGLVGAPAVSVAGQAIALDPNVLGLLEDFLDRAGRGAGKPGKTKLVH